MNDSSKLEVYKYLKKKRWNYPNSNAVKRDNAFKCTAVYLFHMPYYVSNNAALVLLSFQYYITCECIYLCMYIWMYVGLYVLP